MIKYVHYSTRVLENYYTIIVYNYIYLNDDSRAANLFAMSPSVNDVTGEKQLRRKGKCVMKKNPSLKSISSDKTLLS